MNNCYHEKSYSEVKGSSGDIISWMFNVVSILFVSHCDFVDFDKDSGKKDNLVQIIVPIIVLILLVLGTAAGCFIRKRRNRNHGSDIVRNPSDVENVPKERKFDVDDHQHQNQSRDEQSHQNCESGKPVHHDTLPPGEQSKQEL